MRKIFSIFLLSTIIASSIFTTQIIAIENNSYIDDSLSSQTTEKELIYVTHSDMQGWSFDESTDDAYHQFSEEGLITNGNNPTDKAVGRVFLNGEEGINISDIGEIGIKFTETTAFSLPGINLTIAIPDKVSYCNLVYEPWIKGQENSWWATRDLPDFKAKLSTFTLKEFQEKFPETIVYQLGYNANSPNGATIETIEAGNKIYKFGIPSYTEIPGITMIQQTATSNKTVATHQGYAIVGIELNGESLKESDYISTKTEIALTPSYLNTLPPGTHNFTIIMNNDNNKNFTIEIQPSPNNNNNNNSNGNDNDDDDDDDNDDNETANDEIIISSSEEGGEKITDVTIKPEAITNSLTEQDQTITLDLSEEKDSSKITINLKLSTINELENHNAMLEIITNLASYRFHPKDLNMQEIYSQLEGNTEITEGNIAISISLTPKETLETIEQISNEDGFTILTHPVEFITTMSFEDKTLQINRFNAFIERKLLLTEGIENKDRTTCISIDSSGQIRHIPTKIIQDENGTQAIINSMTNSSYVLIDNRKTFTDINDSYAKNTIEKLASKFIINGMGDGSFKPKNETTRAEFIVMLLNAFGIQTNTSQNNFKDITSESWYNKAVNTANEYGIAQGYNDGTFKPNKYITKEEAIAFIMRASQYALLDTTISEEEIEQYLASFSDSNMINDWAKQTVALGIKKGFVVGHNNNLKTYDKINRADAAALINSTLINLELI